jgi:hypothetical protein
VNPIAVAALMNVIEWRGGVGAELSRTPIATKTPMQVRWNPALATIHTLDRGRRGGTANRRSILKDPPAARLLPQDNRSKWSAQETPRSAGATEGSDLKAVYEFGNHAPHLQ